MRRPIGFEVSETGGFTRRLDLSHILAGLLAKPDLKKTSMDDWLEETGNEKPARQVCGGLVCGRVSMAMIQVCSREQPTALLRLCLLGLITDSSSARETAGLLLRLYINAGPAGGRIILITFLLTHILDTMLVGIILPCSPPRDCKQLYLKGRYEAQAEQNCCLKTPKSQQQRLISHISSYLNLQPGHLWDGGSNKCVIYLQQNILEG